MGIFSSMYIARSGMQAHETAISVIGDNLANVNTVGFKRSRGVFADVFYRTLVGGAPVSQMGLGTRLAAIQRMAEQGSLMNTEVVTDLAVAGAGHFILRGDGPLGDEALYYTRNGQMQLDRDGLLVGATGLEVQGFMADANGTLSPTLTSLPIGTATSPPNATQAVAVGVNLDAGTPVNPNAWDPADPANTSQFSTTVTVYDSQGGAHQVDIYFENTGPNQWTWHAIVDGAELQGGAAGNVEVGTGTLTFDANGRLLDETAGPQLVGVQFGNAAPQDITVDFGEALNQGGDGSGSTQHADANAVTFLDQDGYTAGILQFFTVQADGTVIGTFTNGEVRTLAQVALARFAAPGELNGVGDNLFQETQLSGTPAIGEPLTGGRGSVVSGALEQSNVDMTTSFTEMIISQRAFQAASRTITTADEMLAEVVNLKR